MQGLSLEALLTSPDAFALETASPLQRAITRAADGLPVGDLLDADACRRHFGCSPDDLARVAPVIVEVIAGVRSGKSLMAGAAAFKGALCADLSALKPYEIARVPIVAPTIDNAVATYNLLRGAVEAAPALRDLLVEPPSSDTLLVRRADGRIVEIVVCAAHRGGIALRSRWLAGFVLDEVALFGQDSAGYAVNAEELLRAGETRLVPGAQGWLISSPFGPQGLLHAIWKEHFGKPGRVLVAHAPTVAMNTAFPVETVEAVRRRDPDAAEREYDAKFSDAESAMLSSAHIDACIRKAPAPADLPPKPGHDYYATMDPATRGNSWTLAVGHAELAARSQAGQPNDRLRQVIDLAHQWTGSKSDPLSPDAVFREMAGILRPYGVDAIETDGYSADALQDTARRHGLYLIIRHTTQQEKLERYKALNVKILDGDVELHPHPQLRADLVAVRKRVSANAVTVELPKTPDGRHCDFAPSVVTLLARNMAPPHELPTPKTEGQRMEEQAVARWRQRKEIEGSGADWLQQRFADQEDASAGFEEWAHATTFGAALRRQ